MHIGYDHNWSNAGGYPVQLMQDAGSAFDGVSFHCYAVSFVPLSFAKGLTSCLIYDIREMSRSKILSIRSSVTRFVLSVGIVIPG